MTAVLPENSATAGRTPLERVVPAAPADRPLPAEPADRRPRYWDHELAAWRPCPARDRC